MEPGNCDFSGLVKQVRRQLALSQEDLARNLSVSYTTVNRWENGKSKPSKLAKTQFHAFCRNMTKRGRLALPANAMPVGRVTSRGGRNRASKHAAGSGDPAY